MLIYFEGGTNLSIFGNSPANWAPAQKRNSKLLYSSGTDTLQLKFFVLYKIINMFNKNIKQTQVIELNCANFPAML